MIHYPVPLSEGFQIWGASVKDAAGVRNLAQIVRTQGQNVVVVISAMGKTTNALEDLVRAYTRQQVTHIQSHFQSIYTYHNAILSDLTGDFSSVYQTFRQLETYLAQEPAGTFDEIYDQIVSVGKFSLRKSLRLIWRKLD
ncbi:hypothetical protein [Spirosoma sp. KNUC1025]|uniref:hypothetical protein n=1 Tax=Spirosoma sp. KNUC1025 TaxID=2894082 RepID=UPI003866A45A